VGSRICGLVDAVEDGRTGLLHEPADVGDLAAGLRCVIGDPALRCALGEAARARAVRDFSPAILASAVLDLYARLESANRACAQESVTRVADRDGWYRRFGKRAFDVVAASAAIVVLLPVGAALALAIRIVLGSPVLFRQRRPGLNGVPFWLVKFRTMADRRDRAGQLLPDLERLTPLGRVLRTASLDELPELWNVLAGHMSLVGPRPLLMAYLNRYTERQARRHHVPPGITGLAQISGRNALSWDQKFEMDLEYVERCSLALDLRILALTVWQVLVRRGVNQPGHATSEEFMGTVGR
jgi:lipopolysaccharide/colanic/teichoic acid biosynthesis glycosyltransferase